MNDRKSTPAELMHALGNARVSLLVPVTVNDKLTTVMCCLFCSSLFSLSELCRDGGYTPRSCPECQNLWIVDVDDYSRRVEVGRSVRWPSILPKERT